MNGRYRALAVLAVAALAPTMESAAVEDSPGARLAALRAEVDELDAKLQRIRMDARSERLSLETQRGDLEVLLRAEQVRRDTLLRLRARLRSEEREADAWAEALRSPALEAARELRGQVAASLPFQHEARLDAVDAVIADLERPDADPVLATSKLWQLTEDELRLTGECGLHEQVVVVDGERRLAEVARIGMAVLYFMLEDGRVGWARSGSDGPVYEVFSDPERIEGVETLYEALRKQLRQGRFRLPLPPPRTS
ncbi:MAG: DUF3450 family protein [Myxococcota bacterium]